MSARLSAGQRRAAKVRARRGRARPPERARGLLAAGGPNGQPPIPEFDPLEVLEEVDACWPDEDALRTALELAVLRTIASESADAGEQVALRIDDLEDEYGEAVEEEYLDHLDELASTDPMDYGWRAIAWDVLMTWLRTARHRPDAATVAERVLRWVEERLGRAGPGLEQEAIHLGGPGAPQPLDLGECLRDDLVAQWVWLVAGLVAVTGGDGPAAPVHPPGVDTRSPARRHAVAAR
jgi:hypothetical protein